MSSIGVRSTGFAPRRFAYLTSRYQRNSRDCSLSSKCPLAMNVMMTKGESNVHVVVWSTCARMVALTMSEATMGGRGVSSRSRCSSALCCGIVISRVPPRCFSPFFVLIVGPIRWIFLRSFALGMLLFLVSMSYPDFRNGHGGDPGLSPKTRVPGTFSRRNSNNLLYVCSFVLFNELTKNEKVSTGTS